MLLEFASVSDFVRYLIQIILDFVLQLCETSGSSLGYGFSRVVSKAKAQASDSSDENQIGEGTLAI